jgi:hypothetical protein
VIKNFLLLTSWYSSDWFMNYNGSQARKTAVDIRRFCTIEPVTDRLANTPETDGSITPYEECNISLGLLILRALQLTEVKNSHSGKLRSV